MTKTTVPLRVKLADTVDYEDTSSGRFVMLRGRRKRRLTAELLFYCSALLR